MNDAPPPAAVTCREVRLLEGPNLYFTRPAVKVVLRLTGPGTMPAPEVAELASRLGLTRITAGPPGSAARQRVLVRVVERFTRLVTRALGVTRLGLRVRAGAAPDEVVVAAVWRHRARALAVGESLATGLDRVCSGAVVEDVITDLCEHIAAARGGEPARQVTPRIPVVAVTGTNGKTTTTRLLAHLGMTAGLSTAWSSTEGVFAQGELIEPGDYSGPAGARTVLAVPGVQLGVLETARGGMLLRGLGVSANDVSVVTNVSADHLGQQGIDTLDQLAEVKAIITRVTRPTGWCVLNGDDPRVWAMRAGTRATPWVFTLDPDSPAIRQALDAHGRAIVVLDGWVSVLSGDGTVDRLVSILDVPVTLSGLSRHNTANALAATAAALAIGIPEDAVIAGLRTFAPDARLNPGRMNVHSVPIPEGSVTVIVDMAHNEAGLEALLDVAHGLVTPGSRVRLALGTAGDRTDEILRTMGEIAGRRADDILLAHKEVYLRGRTRDEMEAPLRAGLADSGVAHADVASCELEGLEVLVGRATDGDVVAIMCHAERDEIGRWLRSRGATPDDPAVVAAKVRRARGEHPAQPAIDALGLLDDPAVRLAAAQDLAAAHPGDPVVTVELAGALDAAGREEEAVRRYEEALALGLREPLLHRCLVQLASVLRNLGRPTEALARIDEATALVPGSVGTHVFRALVLHDVGRCEEALKDLVTVVAAESTDADVARYRDALMAYARSL